MVAKMPFSASEYSKILKGVSTEIVDKKRVKNYHGKLQLTKAFLDRVGVGLTRRYICTVSAPSVTKYELCVM